MSRSPRFNRHFYKKHPLTESVESVESVTPPQPGETAASVKTQGLSTTGAEDGESWTYRRAGVDIDAGAEVVRRIAPLAASTARPGVLGSLGGFGGFFSPPIGRYHDPVLVAGADGVGTKLKVAFALNRHDTVGVDLVAMCVNDLLVHGAEPLFFLDYLAIGRVDPDVIERVVAGIARGCRLAGCALLGGETAEHPGDFPPGEYDLAGFAVGIAERDRLLDGSRIVPGDVLIGLPSTGLHSNGYSLARKVLLEAAGYRLDERLPGLEETLGEELLSETAIYVRPILTLLEGETRPVIGIPVDGMAVKGMAHITGGGISENLPRILPEGCHAVLSEDRWTIPPIFDLIREAGRIQKPEMHRVFNMGLGMILAVEREAAETVTARLDSLGQPALPVGEIIAGRRGVDILGG